jgi:hypothetical protein
MTTGKDICYGVVRLRHNLDVFWATIYNPWETFHNTRKKERKRLKG